MKKTLALLASALYLDGCQSDTVGVDDIDIIAEPVIALPIGDVNLTLDHIFTPDDSLIFADNMDYQVVVAQDSVFALSVSDFFTLPSQSPSSSSFSMGTIPVSSVSMSNAITLGNVANDASLTAINTAHGQCTLPSSEPKQRWNLRKRWFQFVQYSLFLTRDDEHDVDQ